ncbi:MAG: hypothetical protein FJ267_03355, partial [Planctomycetes bacterium]|nr:hypothetical protein [Planctomycetota bacterium]
MTIQLKSTFHPFATAVASLFACLFTVDLHADLIKLTNGGELRGRVITATTTTHSTNGSSASPTKQSSSNQIRLVTLSGATIVVEKDETQFLTKRPLMVEEYESRAKRVANTLEAHWELAEWCRQKSLPDQRQIELLRVIEFDSDHEKAQAALGRVWNDGAWVDRDEMMAAQGYVKHKGRYVTTQELDILQKTTAELEQERDWFQKVKLWHGWLSGRMVDKRQLGMTSLQQIKDHHAAPAVIRFLCDDRNPDTRMLGVSVLANLSGGKSVAGLVRRSLYDSELEVRYAALNGIRPENFEIAQSLFTRELK